ncbi:MAG: hypothetical protein N3F66_02815 [Spirochaetes bacterium]|nr:hypothetical protein [Spirochaetota bacterium]
MLSPFIKPEGLERNSYIYSSVNSEYTSLPIPSELSEGIRNFTIYQKYNYFAWPYWISRYVNTVNERIQSLPFFLYNNHCRTWYTINSFLSSGSIRIDPSGMVQPAWASWSLEFWMYIDDIFVRFHDDTYIFQDIDNGIIKTVYNHPDFIYRQSLYITHTNIDEAVVVNNVQCKKKNKAFFVVAIRPYTTETLSGLYSVEYGKNNFIRINNEYHCNLLVKPDIILTGDEISGDIDFKRKDNKYKVTSSESMATMAFAYEVSGKEFEIPVRVAVNKNSKISVPKFDTKKSINEYTSYINLRMQEGVGINLGKNIINEWVNFCKFSTLVEAANFELLDKAKKQDFSNYYFAIMALNRMGYPQQSLSIINYLLKNIKMKDDFDSVVSAAYLSNIIGDYYRIYKDSEFLQKHYPVCKQYAYALVEFCRELKNIRQYILLDNFNEMTINHAWFIPVVISGLENLAFMSRSLGLFGDETKFLEQANKLEKTVLNVLFHIAKDTSAEEEKLIEWVPKQGKPLRKQKISFKENLEFSNSINIFNNRILKYASFFYPFMAHIIMKYTTQKIIDDIILAGKGLPLYDTIISGIDVISSLSLANSMLYGHDARAVDIIYAIITLCKKRKFLPHFLDPVSGHAIVKEPVSIIAVSLLFQAIRNLCFIDYPERLELFPVPVQEWFSESAIVISNAPSRFGTISFVTSSTSNEFVIQFTDIPRFIPHDILINLPFKAKIKKSDDFIVKYETERSWCINGWPLELRFKR